MDIIHSEKLMREDILNKHLQQLQNFVSTVVLKNGLI